MINRPQVEPQETLVHKGLLRLVADVDLAVHQVLASSWFFSKNFPPNNASMGDPTPLNLERSVLNVHLSTRCADSPGLAPDGAAIALANEVGIQTLKLLRRYR